MYLKDELKQAIVELMDEVEPMQRKLLKQQYYTDWLIVMISMFLLLSNHDIINFLLDLLR